jgi:hypothetical protein
MYTRIRMYCVLCCNVLLPMAFHQITTQQWNTGREASSQHCWCNYLHLFRRCCPFVFAHGGITASVRGLIGVLGFFLESSRVVLLSSTKEAWSCRTHWLEGQLWALSKAAAGWCRPQGMNLWRAHADGSGGQHIAAEIVRRLLRMVSKTDDIHALSSSSSAAAAAAAWLISL